MTLDLVERSPAAGSGTVWTAVCRRDDLAPERGAGTVSAAAPVSASTTVQ